MPILSIPNYETSTTYYMVCYNNNGNERDDDTDGINGCLSAAVLQKLKTTAFTDIFLLSHGWKGDMPAAQEQFDSWISTMMHCEGDIKKLKARPQGFSPLIIGLHWPSLIYGDEEYASLNENESSFGSADNEISSISSSEEGQRAAQKILAKVEESPAPIYLDKELENAIDYLISVEVVSEDGYKLPEEDLITASANSIYKSLKRDWDKENKAEDEGEMSFGGSGPRSPLLNLLTQLSIWKMKSRARVFGEAGAAKLLRSILSGTTNSTKVHLMGHSLGAVVVSSCITGKNGEEALPRPIDNVYLLQGAVSLWSYCESIPLLRNVAGYYRNLSKPEFLKGSVLVTHTENDSAVGIFYPLAAKTSLSDTFSEAFNGELPRYGGLGVFGAQGNDFSVEDLKLLSSSADYNFTQNTFYNLEADSVIRDHNDIAHPEVAHAFWSAILSGDITNG